MAEVVYCDDYEAIVGPKPKDPKADVVTSKVVTAPEPATPAPATVAETK